MWYKAPDARKHQRSHIQNQQQLTLLLLLRLLLTFLRMQFASFLLSINHTTTKASPAMSRSKERTMADTRVYDNGSIDVSHIGPQCLLGQIQRWLLVAAKYSQVPPCLLGQIQRWLLVAAKYSQVPPCVLELTQRWLSVAAKYSQVPPCVLGQTQRWLSVAAKYSQVPPCVLGQTQRWLSVAAKYSQVPPCVVHRPKQHNTTFQRHLPTEMRDINRMERRRRFRVTFPREVHIVIIAIPPRAPVSRKAISVTPCMIKRFQLTVSVISSVNERCVENCGLTKSNLVIFGLVLEFEIKRIEITAIPIECVHYT